MGSVAVSPVQVMLSTVWEATCPRLSPVITAPHSHLSARRQAMRIMKRRIIVIMKLAGQCLCMASWMSVKGTTKSFILPVWAETMFLSSTTFSLAFSEV